MSAGLVPLGAPRESVPGLCPSFWWPQAFPRVFPSSALCASLCVQTSSSPKDAVILDQTPPYWPHLTPSFICKGLVSK